MGTESSVMSADEAEEYTQALGQVVSGGFRQVALGKRLGVPQALGLSVEQWVEQRLGGYVRMSVEARREAVAELSEEGMSTREIGSVLGVSHETVASDVRNLTEPPAATEPKGDAVVRNLTLPESEPPAPAVTPEPPTGGPYRCIVVDPPWPMEKIKREVRPLQQKHLDYPTLNLDEIEDLVGRIVGEKADENCHVYLWVTQRFLPAGLALLERWGVSYQCQMTWVKNVGPTPFSWMYDTEHVLFGRIGSLRLLENGLRLSFAARADGHSVKPAVFYQRVLAASPGPRLAVFERNARDGFEVWGNEAPV